MMKLNKGDTIEEGVDKITFTSIGIKKISLHNLKEFQRFCLRECDNDYGRGIALLLDFYKQGITTWLMDHEQRLRVLEGEPENEKPKRTVPKTFGPKEETENE